MDDINGIDITNVEIQFLEKDGIKYWQHPMTKRLYKPVKIFKDNDPEWVVNSANDFLSENPHAGVIYSNSTYTIVIIAALDDRGIFLL